MYAANVFGQVAVLHESFAASLAFKSDRFFVKMHVTLMKIVSFNLLRNRIKLLRIPLKSETTRSPCHKYDRRTVFLWCELACEPSICFSGSNLCCKPMKIYGLLNLFESFSKSLTLQTELGLGLASCFSLSLGTPSKLKTVRMSSSFEFVSTHPEYNKVRALSTSFESQPGRNRSAGSPSSFLQGKFSKNNLKETKDSTNLQS